MFKASVKLLLKLEPFWASQKECSRQMTTAEHVTVRNQSYKKGGVSDQTYKSRQRWCLWKLETISGMNWEEWGDHTLNWALTIFGRLFTCVNKVGTTIQIEPNGCRATHSLDRISWQYVSKSNGAHKAYSNSRPGWDFMAACWEVNKLMKHTATHLLDGISWQHVRKLNQAHKAHSNSLPGISRQYVSISNQAHKHTATHSLDGISCQHASKSNQAHKAQSNSQAGWDFKACPYQIKLTKHTATHWLDGISWQNVSKSNQAHKAISNSLPGWDFILACQQIKSSSQSTQQLTRWWDFIAAC